MYINIFIILFIILLSLYFFLKKFNFLVENVNYSEHKKIGVLNKSPVILGGIYITISIFFFATTTFYFLKIICIFFLILGFLSDRNYLSNPLLRIFLQILILFFFIYFENISINSIRIDFFDNFLKFNFINIFFTLFCFAILLNGSNFLDGLNGLLSGYYLLVLGSVIYLNLYLIDIKFQNLEIINLIFLILLTFFILNIFGLIYLGDSGSYVIALIVGYILIVESGNNLFVSPYYVAAVLWYPAFENLFTIIRRLIKKDSVSSADKKHLHQLIFRYIKSKKYFNKKIINTLSSLIILIINLPIFIIATLNFSHTSTLIFIIICYLAVYLFVYYLIINFFLKSYK